MKQLSKKIMKRILTVACISVVLYACSPKTGFVLYTPAPADATDSVSYEQLVAGRQIFVSHCGKCHNLKLPQSRTELQWRKALVKMQPKAKISDDEKQLILNFLLVKAKK
jgi:hypothetical protein